MVYITGAPVHHGEQRARSCCPFDIEKVDRLAPENCSSAVFDSCQGQVSFLILLAD
jgi:hypothetical protein